MISRREFNAGLLFGLGNLLLPRNSYGLSQSIETQTASWKNGNHAFITQAKNNKYRAEIVSAREITGKSFASTKEVLERTQAYVCLNGGFFENDGSTSGLYVRKGKIVKPYTLGKGGGVLYTDKKYQAHIVTENEFTRHRNDVVDAIQVNLLRSADKIMYKEDINAKKLPRNLIGIASGGLVDVIFKDTNFTLGDRYMKITYGCDTVAALDGGPSASGVDKFGNNSFRKGDIKEVEVPNFLCLWRKW